MKTTRSLFAPLAFAIYPILALLAHNIQEVSFQVALRPILLSLAVPLASLLVLRLLLKDLGKASLVTTFLLILFFSYGHIYALLENVSLSGLVLGRHRYLIVIYAMLLVAGLWYILARLKDTRRVSAFLNVMGVALLILPTIQLGLYLARASASQKEAAQVVGSSQSVLTPRLQPLPDIYYIVLDTHTRSDALLQDYAYDNSAYLDELRAMGFYIADCSRPNYGYTQASIVSTLNLDYIQTLEDEYHLGKDIWALLRESRVRSQLEAIGYKTIAFDTGYEWSRLTDADIYLSLGSDSYAMQAVTPFESMLLKSTAFLILSDSQNQFLRARFQEINFPFSFHVNSQRFILEQLPKLPQEPGPKFVFVHLLIPHYPFVFDANGEVVTDPGFYSGDKGGPINKDYLRQGYVNEVEFIDRQMADIMKKILDQSTTPPIIIIHGDHGLRGDNRYKILNAYYLPGDGSQRLYPSITPVNSFRLIFDIYYGTQYGLLDDVSYSNEGQIVPETSPDCLP